MIHIFSRFLVFYFFIVFQANATRTFSVYDYNEEGFFVRKETKLIDLISNETFDGKYFKIIKSKGSQAINFNDVNYALKAAHIYYHLSKAREFFKKMKYVNHAHLDKKINIRIDLKNVFDNYAHYAHDDYNPEFNTAVTIPASNEDRIPSVPPWEIEIWFRPSKEIFTAGRLSTLGNLFDSRTVKRDLQVAVIQTGLIGLLGNGISNQIYTNFEYDTNFLNIAIGVTAIEFLPKIIIASGAKYKRKYFLDTGMIPEIIYHEYSHFALADYVPLTSTPVIEGLANYFAGRIGNKAQWGNQPSQWSADRGRNALSIDLYNFRVENNIYATGDFVYKLLWGLQKIFSTTVTDELVYLSRVKVKRDSNIKFDLINNIFHSLFITGHNDINHKLKLHQYMQKLGL